MERVPLKMTTTVTGAAIRRLTLEAAKRANTGHIGSALSVADILAVLYGGVLRIASPADPERDRFVMSKGHAALALYAALQLRGCLEPGAVSTYCASGTSLGVHPSHEIDGVECSTGSLGQGLSIAAGMALAARLHGASWRAFVLMSDAECNEGSVWEAAMFAAQHRLENLTAIIDLNGQQALGATSGILDLSPMSARWQAFGWDAHDVDGHDPLALAHTLGACAVRRGAPHLIVAHTVFGKGVSFMERQLKWHYAPMSDADYDAAMREVASA